MWLGTYYGGVSYYHPLARRFGVLRNVPSRNSLGDNTVGCIVEESDSMLWIGTNDDGVNLYDRRTGRFRNTTSITAPCYRTTSSASAPTGAATFGSAPMRAV